MNVADMTNPAETKLYRITFSHSDFLRLPKEDQLFFIRLAHVTDDLRHVFYLCVTAERGTRSDSADERKLALHQLLFGVRLIYSILHEGWRVIDSAWNGKAIGKQWNSRLSDDAKNGLAFLGKYFAQSNLSRTIRDHFGFHYLPDLLQEPLAHVSGRNDEIITGRHSANIFYSFAEEIRALAMLQTTRPPDARKLWDDDATEADIRAAAVTLYESFRPVRDAFDAFANNVLPQVVKSLPHKTQQFIPPRLIKFSEMSPALFVEEPSDKPTPKIP